jgi:hypothetical protein
MRFWRLSTLVPFWGAVACADPAGPSGSIDAWVVTTGVIPSAQYCVSAEVRERTLGEVTYSDGSRQR